MKDRPTEGEDRQFPFVDEWFVAVGAGTTATGVKRQDDKKGTTDWRAPKWSAANKRGVVARYENVELADALHHVWNDECYFVTYVVRDADGRPLPYQPRVTYGGVDFVRSTGHTIDIGVFAADIDNVPHEPWTQDGLQAFFELLASAPPILRTCGVYLTEKGWRLVQPLTRRISPEEAKPALAAWVSMLHEAGIVADVHCKDWTRHFRLPKTMRKKDDKLVPSHFEPMLESMTPVDPALFVETRPAPTLKEQRKERRKKTDDTRKERQAEKRRERQRAERQLPKEFHDELPAWWPDRAEAIAQAIRTTVPDGFFHNCYLAVSGALLLRKVPSEFLPALLWDIAIRAGSKKPYEKRQGAETTVAKWANGEPFIAMKYLRANHPSVAIAVSKVAPPSDWESREDGGDGGIVELELDEARDVGFKTLLYPEPGINLLQSPAGAGKSHQASASAIERANMRPRAPGSTRAPLESKTGLTFDKNILSIQQYKQIENDGYLPKRVFGVASFVDANGETVCKFPEAAKALSSGAQSVVKELCEGRGIPGKECPHQAFCAAYQGFEGDANSQILLGTHALLKKVDKEIGKTGVLIVDEPPGYLEHVPFKIEQIVLLPPDLPRYFESKYVTAMRPVVSAALAWAQIREAEEAVEVREMIAQGSDAIDYHELQKACDATGTEMSGDSVADAIECCIRALEYLRDKATGKMRRGEAPPLKLATIFRMKSDPDCSGGIGLVSKFLATLRAALTSPHRQIVRAERGSLTFTGPSPHLAPILAREGPLVLMDANPEPYLPILEKILGVPIQDTRRHVRIHVKDAQPVRRIWVQYKKALKSKWFIDGKVVWKSGILRVLENVIHTANETPGAEKLCLITFKFLRVLIESIVHPHRKMDALSAWAEMVPALDVDEVEYGLNQLRPILAEWKGEWILGHYRGVRGMNNAIGCDVIATIGDPWSNVATIQHENQYLGLDEAAAAERGYLVSAAELNQAQERARSVCRKKALTAIHVGNVMPDNYKWESADIIDGSTGLWIPTECDDSYMSDIIAAYSLTASQVSTALGCSRKLAVGLAAGEKPLSQPQRLKLVEYVERMGFQGPSEA